MLEEEQEPSFPEKRWAVIGSPRPCSPPPTVAVRPRTQVQENRKSEIVKNLREQIGLGENVLHITWMVVRLACRQRHQARHASARGLSRHRIRTARLSSGGRLYRLRVI